MAATPKFYILEASALPEVILKVAEAKRLLETGEVSTVNEAARRLDISRSAFYKYRDSVFPFHDLMTGRIITFQLMLHDEPGVLSSILSCFARWSCNILTINQTIPTNGCALVTVTAETVKMTSNLEELLNALNTTSGVIKAEVLAG